MLRSRRDRGVADPMIQSLQRPDMTQEDPRALLHRLNNQLGVILAHAELLETKAQDPAQKARASQVVAAALQAMAVSRELREKVCEN